MKSVVKKLKFPNFFRSADTSQVVLRQKTEQRNRHDQIMSDEEDRKTRRISYLRATANDIDSDVDSSPVSQAPDTPDDESNINSQQLKRWVSCRKINLKIFIFLFDYNWKKPFWQSAYKPWRRPRLTSDIQPLRRLFEETPPSVNLPPIIETISRELNNDTTADVASPLSSSSNKSLVYTTQARLILKNKIKRKSFFLFLMFFELFECYCFQLIYFYYL